MIRKLLNQIKYSSINNNIQNKLLNTFNEFPFKEIHKKNISSIDKEIEFNSNEKLMFQYFVEQEFNLILNEKDFSETKNLKDISNIIEQNNN